MAMSSTQFEKLMTHLDKKFAEISNNLQIHASIHRKNSPARYPSIGELQRRAKGCRCECKQKTLYECEMCDNKRRNDCWKRMEKVVKKNELLKNLPYNLPDLTEMKTSQLWIIATHLDVNFIGRAKTQLVIDIYKKEKKKGMIKETALINWECKNCHKATRPLAKWPVKDKIKHCPDCGVSMEAMPLPKRRNFKKKRKEI